MRRKMVRAAAILMAAAMIAGTLTGCGGGNQSTATQAAAGGETQATAGGAAQAAAGGSAAAEAPAVINAEAPAEGVALKDDIVIGMKSKHTTIDSMEASNAQHNYMWRMIYDTPVHFNNKTG